MLKSVCSILILLMMSCAYGCIMLLEYKDVNFIKVRETQSEPVISLEISGLAMHSSLEVEKIKTKAEDKSLVVLVYLTLARNGLRGDFTYNFDIPDRVDSVVFGPDKHLIWKRGVGPVK
jgi:hypothetical protein